MGIESAPKDAQAANRAEVQAHQVQRGVEEKLRLLYVALTRAEKWLIICSAGKVTEGGDNWYSLVADAMGNLAESATANVFLVKDGTVFTPIPNGTFLAGITRARHIANLRADGVTVIEKVLTFDDAHAADEIFLSGNFAKVTSVRAFDDTAFKTRAMTDRARARSLCAEMHSGFTALRGNCPMNIEANLADAGALIWRDKAGVRTDVQRLVEMWSALLQEHGGPILFCEFTVADAYFAPVCMRLHSYALPVPTPIKAYVDLVRALPGVKAWIDEALAEKDFLDFEEPYRLRHTEG